MNAKISRTINGQRIAARPVFKGGVQPAYWAGTVNGHTLPQTFASPTHLFRFAENLRAPD